MCLLEPNSEEQTLNAATTHLKAFQPNPPDQSYSVKGLPWITDQCYVVKHTSTSVWVRVCECVEWLLYICSTWLVGWYSTGHSPDFGSSEAAAAGYALCPAGGTAVPSPSWIPALLLRRFHSLAMAGKHGRALKSVNPDGGFQRHGAIRHLYRQTSPGSPPHIHHHRVELATISAVHDISSITGD